MSSPPQTAPPPPLHAQKPPQQQQPPASDTQQSAVAAAAAAAAAAADRETDLTHSDYDNELRLIISRDSPDLWDEEHTDRWRGVAAATAAAPPPHRAMARGPPSSYGVAGCATSGATMHKSASIGFSELAVRAHHQRPRNDGGGGGGDVSSFYGYESLNASRSLLRGSFTLLWLFFRWRHSTNPNNFADQLYTFHRHLVAPLSKKHSHQYASYERFAPPPPAPPPPQPPPPPAPRGDFGNGDYQHFTAVDAAAAAASAAAATNGVHAHANRCSIWKIEDKKKFSFLI